MTVLKPDQAERVEKLLDERLGPVLELEGNGSTAILTVALELEARRRQVREIAEKLITAEDALDQEEAEGNGAWARQRIAEFRIELMKRVGRYHETLKIVQRDDFTALCAKYDEALKQASRPLVGEGGIACAELEQWKEACRRLCEIRDAVVELQRQTTQAWSVATGIGNKLGLKTEPPRELSAYSLPYAKFQLEGSRIIMKKFGTEWRVWSPDLR